MKRKATQKEVIEAINKDPKLKKLLLLLAEENKDPDGFAFSKDLRDKLEPFGKMDTNEALGSPDFLNVLLDSSGLSESQKKDLWEKVGRPDFYREKT